MCTMSGEVESIRDPWLNYRQHTHSHWHTHSQSLSHTLSQTLSLTHTLTHSLSLTHTLTHTMLQIQLQYWNRIKTEWSKQWRMFGTEGNINSSEVLSRKAVVTTCKRFSSKARGTQAARSRGSDWNERKINSLEYPLSVDSVFSSSLNGGTDPIRQKQTPESPHFSKIHSASQSISESAWNLFPRQQLLTALLVQMDTVSIWAQTLVNGEHSDFRRCKLPTSVQWISGEIHSRFNKGTWGDSDLQLSLKSQNCPANWLQDHCPQRDSKWIQHIEFQNSMSWY